jgi:hypothetical protein
MPCSPTKDSSISFFRSTPRNTFILWLWNFGCRNKYIFRCKVIQSEALSVLGLSREVVKLGGQEYLYNYYFHLLLLGFAIDRSVWRLTTGWTAQVLFSVNMKVVCTVSIQTQKSNQAHIKGLPMFSPKGREAGA